LGAKVIFIDEKDGVREKLLERLQSGGQGHLLA
jgi:hypothetical protein